MVSRFLLPLYSDCFTQFIFSKPLGIHNVILRTVNCGAKQAGHYSSISPTEVNITLWHISDTFSLKTLFLFIITATMLLTHWSPGIFPAVRCSLFFVLNVDFLCPKCCTLFTAFLHIDFWILYSFSKYILNHKSILQNSLI